MITKARHTGIVVRDLSYAIDFYLGLGFEPFSREIEQGEFIDQVVNLSDVKVETAKLRSPCGFLLELLQYHSHPESKEINLQSSNRLGCSHIAFTVISIDKTLKKINSMGGRCPNLPATSSFSKVKVAYCHDLEGNLLEIVEELN
jgi:catechol 2,3-dioxygenase-like lactoylglutathione lyase family enzyme